MSVRERKKVLFVIPSGYCFGLQNIILDFLIGSNSAFDSHFLLTRWTDGEIEKRLRGMNIPFSYSWLGMFSRKLDWNNVKMTLSCLAKLPLLYWHFVILIIRYRPDKIVFANNHEILLLMPFLFFMRRKVICHMHDPPPSILFQRVLFFSWRYCVGKFIFISESTRTRTLGLGSIADHRMVVIYNGVRIFDEQTLKRNPKYRSVDISTECGVSFGMAGQIISNKGHDDFVNAAKDVLIQYPKTQFLIAGKSRDTYATALIAKCRSYGIEKSVRFVGWVEELSDFLQDIDVLVFPSRHIEGFGLLVAEAMEHERAVIATDSGGVREVVADGITGLLIPRGDSCALARSMLHLIEDRTAIDNMGRKGRERVIKHFNIANQRVKFWRELCN